jgi:hypothetical protein
VVAANQEEDGADHLDEHREEGTWVEVFALGEDRDSADQGEVEEPMVTELTGSTLGLATASDRVRRDPRRRRSDERVVGVHRRGGVFVPATG